MKKLFGTLSLLFVLSALPNWAFAQAVVFQNLEVRPAILCSGSPATVTFDAALPGNSTAGQSLYLYGTIDSSATVSATSNVFLWSGTTYNTGTDTFTGTTTVLSPSYNATWFMTNPAFANFVTYTAVITAIPAYTNGTVVYITIGGANSYVSGYTEPYSIQIPVTVNCNASDAINTGSGVYISGGVTYTGNSNAVTVLVSNSGCSTNTFTNTPTMTNTPTKTNTETNTSTPTPTKTQTNTSTNTPTPTVTNTRTNTNSPTPSPTNTSTNTVTNTATVLNTNTNTVTNTRTPTATVTNTATATNTRTPTVTATVTSTQTNTETLVNTATVTNTRTNTSTNTPTNTQTSTFTATITNTQTNTETFVNTPTVTNTRTNTNTSTPTNTQTPSPTVTNSQTSTDTLLDTATNTNTATNTATLANSATDTNTVTVTNTQTNTNTLINTATPTNTITVTNTKTSTVTSTQTATSTNTFIPTSTSTSTVTNTASPTATSTVSISIGKVVSETFVHVGDTITYSIGVTVTGNNVNGAVITDALPSYIDFKSFVGTQVGNASFNTLTDQILWTLPSSLAPGVYKLTYNTQLDSSAQANAPLINKAQFSAPGSATLTSQAPVTVVGNFTVMVNVYNSAGEVVKSIKVQNLTQPVNNINLSTTNTITTLQGPGSTINIIFNGIVIGSWDGTNNSGKPVSNGQYKVQVDNVGTGVVTSVSQNATVNRALADVQANVYNGAGELVRTLYSVVSDAMSSSLNNVSLSTSVFQPGTTTSAAVTAKSSTNELQVLIETSGTPVTLLWDGANNGGTIVTPGEYTLEVHWNNGAGQTEDISRTLLVTAATAITGKVIAKPNQLIPGDTMTTHISAAAITNAAGIKVRIFTLAGELVKTIMSNTTEADWNASNVASGLYLANVEVESVGGGVVTRQFVKILVLH